MSATNNSVCHQFVNNVIPPLVAPAIPLRIRKATTMPKVRKNATSTHIQANNFQGSFFIKFSVFSGNALIGKDSNLYLCRFQNRITHKPRALQKEYKKTTGISQYPSHIVENLQHILKQSAIDERHEKPFSGEKSEHFRVNIGLRFARKQVLAASYPNRYSRRMSSNFNGTFLPFHDLNFHFYCYVRHRHIA